MHVTNTDTDICKGQTNMESHAYHIHIKSHYNYIIIWRQA